MQLGLCVLVHLSFATSGAVVRASPLLSPVPLKMKHVAFFGGLLLLLPTTFVVADQSDAQVGVTVQTSSGPVSGHPALNRTQVSEYLGIPYAQPPLGDLRFAAPQTYSSSKPLTGASYVRNIHYRTGTCEEPELTEILTSLRMSLAVTKIKDLADL